MSRLGIYASQITGKISSNSYESIQTYTLGSSQSSVTFSSIPSTYKHLQVRILVRSDRSAGTDILSLRMNSDSSSIYTDHLIYGDGSSALTDQDIGATKINLHRVASAANAASIFSAYVIDVLDYANTNKNKTVRALGGFDANGSGRINFGSGIYRSTSAISSMAFSSVEYSGNWVANSSFALYGIKG